MLARTTNRGGLWSSTAGCVSISFEALGVVQPDTVEPLFEPKVGIVVLNWNSWRDVCDCVDSIRSLRYKNYEIYVVDNASTDGSEYQLQIWDAKLRILQTGSNLGWSGGNNVGISAAIADGCLHIFLVNPDIRVERDTLTSLVAAANDESVAAVGSVVLSAANPDWVEFCGSIIDPTSGLPSQISGRITELKLNNTMYISTIAVKGCSMLLTPKGIEKVGLLDPSYFLNFDETDWCFRARKLGMCIRVSNTSIVHHKGAVSFQGTTSPLYRYFIARNRLLFARNHLDRRGKTAAWRASLWEAKRAIFLPIDDQGAGWRRRILLVYVVMLAIRDYLTHKFGDCPPSVRVASRIFSRLGNT